LDAALDESKWATTDTTLISNVDAQAHSAPDEWRELLRRQLTSPVEFLDAVLRLPEDVQVSVEMPPGNVLTGLTKRIRPFEVQLAPATLEELQEIDL
jgi:[acyl-carrier-protein] S-malonyltransferase